MNKKTDRRQDASPAALGLTAEEAEAMASEDPAAVAARGQN